MSYSGEISNNAERQLFVESIFDDTGMFGIIPEEFEDRNVDTEERTDLYEGSMSVGDDLNTEAMGSVEVVDASLFSGAIREGGPESVRNMDEAPYSGMVVGNVIEAFVLYSNYARRMGFEIRFRSSERKRRGADVADEGRRKGMKKGLGCSWFYSDYEGCSRIRLQCVKGEVPRPNRRDPSRAVRSQKCKCQAGVSLLNNDDRCWTFSTVKLQHNHPCDPETTRFMKSYRIVKRDDELKILVCDVAKITPARIYTSLAVGYGGVDKVPFLSDDCRSVVRKYRRSGMDAGDFNGMQTLFNEMIVYSKDFFYLYEKDDEGRVTNVFWADGRSRLAYKEFGDVISFDTTHLKNRYKMPLAPFIGVNHHGQSILLGLALISSEDTESFIWVFSVWLKCMSNQHPICILTDQCQAIGNAIRHVFPNARHRWCLWHVMRNGDRHLRRLNEWRTIRTQMKEAVHDSRDVHSFERQWTEMVVQYSLQDNEWMTRMYAHRNRWVPVFFKDEFWAGLHSTQRSEGMNNFFRTYVNLNTSLREFAEQYCSQKHISPSLIPIPPPLSPIYQITTQSTLASPQNKYPAQVS